jgi:hypothetical protein
MSAARNPAAINAMNALFQLYRETLPQDDAQCQEEEN